MKTVKKTVQIPITITVKDQDGNEIGSGSGTITVEYQYEVPDMIDFITKGTLPAVGIDLIIKGVSKL